MNTFDLPLHPTMRHPLTGAPLRALAARPGGGHLWPMMGGAPDDPDPKNDPDPKDPPNDPDPKDPKKDPDPKDPPKPKPGVPDGYAIDTEGNSLGYPKDTARADMTRDEQLSYDAFHGRKHEARARAYREATGGKSADEVKADYEELEKLRREGRSEGENAVKDAEEKARTEERKRLGTEMARVAFTGALSHVDDERRARLLTRINLSEVIQSDGTIDTAKVSEIAEDIAPRDKRDPDYGGGRRGGGGGKTGVEAGQDAYARRHGKKEDAKT